ncbi:hypothetical protein BCU84_06325 [Shewanella sp. 10N.286.51.B7]|uniref:putative porin n=1 Tax=Shewanella sp. 10N.286.51.B7 TaxID=1880836 RepID=UPI000C82D211|nr:putative porin [Shewanella sp. 10N.286.51.B7]PMG78955.1 hypothetical protein BCU84_06325 [Shewanella sp. 10N.286.51.B7]
MTINKLSLSVILCLASGASFAEDTTSSTSGTENSTENTFHHEAEIGFLDTSENSDGLVSGKYSYYFQGVDQTDVPLELATYLSQSSVVSARYATTDHQDLYALRGEYIFDSRFFIGGAYSLVTTERDWFDYYDEDQDTYEINAGYYFNPYTKLTLSYSTYEQTSSTSGRVPYTSLTTGNSKSSVDHNGFSAKYEHYLPFEVTSGLMLTAIASYAKTEEEFNGDSIFPIDNVNNDYIFATSYVNSDQTIKETQLAINADWYVTNAWAVSIGYEFVNHDYKGSYNRLIQPVNDSQGDYEHYNESYDNNFNDSDSFNYFKIGTSYFWNFSKYISARALIEQAYVDSESNTSFGVAINARF